LTMRTQTLSLLLLGLGLAAASVLPETRQEWEEFKSTHSKKYATEEEEHTRFGIFLDNKKIIAEHNALFEAGEISWGVGMNAFGDLTDAEFKSMYTGQVMPRDDAKVSCSSYFGTGSAPESYDHRDHGAVTPVKDQGQCGSCWSFGATGSAEGQYFKSTGQSASLSEQNLLDCAQNWGCNGGGRSDIALDYVTSSGVNSESVYPYEMAQGWCRQSSAYSTYHCSGCVYTAAWDENELKNAVASETPVAVAIDASPLHFQFYRTGIIDDPTCGTDYPDLNHAVLAVGYGTNSQGQKYWTIKNSWGTWWGDAGYFQLARDKGNMCGVSSDTVFAKGPCYAA
ncbi:unnamed protein product, partial [Meganyctiphanes norvegica]